MTFKLYLLLMALSYLRPFDLFAPELAVYRPMLILLMIVLVMSLVTTRKTGGGILTGQHIRLIWALLLAVTMSVTLVEGFGNGMNSLVSFLPTVLLFLISGLNLTSLKRVKITGAVIVASLVVLSCMSIACFHTGFMKDVLILKQHGSDDSAELAAMDVNEIPALDTSGRYLWRVRSVGFLADPNDFAQTIVCFMPVLFAFYQARRHLRNLLFLGLPAGILLYTIFLTHSRGSLLGLAALFFFNIKERLGTIKTGLLLGTMAMGAMAFNFTGGRAYSANEESAGGRIDAWSEGLVMLRNYPILGVGYQRFSEHHSHTAHNILVVTFGEIGFVGYWIWLGLIILTFKQLSQAIKLVPVNADEHTWLIRLRTSIFGFFTCGMFLSRAFEPPLFILLILCLGVWHAGKMQVSNTPAAKELAAPMLWRGRTVLLMFISIMAIWSIVMIKTMTVGRSV